MEDSSGNVADKEDLECVKKEIIGKFMGANKRTSLSHQAQDRKKKPLNSRSVGRH